MKTKFHPKFITVFCLFSTVVVISQTTAFKDNSGQDLSHKKSSQQSQTLLAEKLSTTLEITSGLTSATNFLKPFTVSGKGIPGSTVEIEISPFYKANSELAGKNLKSQSYIIKVNADSSWTVRCVPVFFPDRATEKRVYIKVYQSSDKLYSNPIQKIFKINN